MFSPCLCGFTLGIPIHPHASELDRCSPHTVVPLCFTNIPWFIVPKMYCHLSLACLILNLDVSMQERFSPDEGHIYVDVTVKQCSTKSRVYPILSVFCSQTGSDVLLWGPMTAACQSRIGGASVVIKHCTIWPFLMIIMNKP